MSILQNFIRNMLYEPAPAPDSAAPAPTASAPGQATRHEHEDPAPTMTESDLTGLRALVADDNPINLQIIDSFLRRLGLETTLVENGRQAVDAWAPGRFDVLCLDISMPELDGASALRQIHARARATGATPTPAVAVTASALPHQVAEHLAAGFAGCIAKPVRRLQIGEELVRVLGKGTHLAA